MIIYLEIRPKYIKNIESSLESHNYWARVPRARAPQQEKPPLTTTRESPRTAMKTQCSQK